ncbi:zinc finger protein 391-like [Pseudomyrmex gracilis]|uniref:zinc finger protein 391-like n=1 Tax=Pseudomyrmex gracilis TaxID=219809 RepID=UPI0009957E9E|nr:zinc finger protein 391-like [Pseudomyrmex gracilis]
MSEQCPNCRQLANSSFSRLVKDSCGHTKCRMCLVYEEHGCKICQDECSTQSVRDYSKESHIQDGNPNRVNAVTGEEIALPLELVIHKDPKFTEISSKSTSFENRSSDHYQKSDISDENQKIHETPNETVTTNENDRIYIPKIETRDVVLNIEAHLRDESNHNLLSLKNSNDSQTKEKTSRETVEKSKSAKNRDRSHIIVIPGTPERYKCNVCGKIFRNKKGKCYHDACVTGVKPYQCTFCDKTFVKRSHFEYHERVHNGYKPYKCSLCEKAFPQKNKLNRHMFSHSKEKQFACTVCDKRYSKPDDLKNHSTIHNATTTYNCQSCNKSFRVLTNLNRHMRTHTDERPYKCDQCNKSFKDRFLLVRHKRIHGKERPFSCACCNRVFLSKSELRRHTTVHSDEKPFSCEHCQTLFRRKDNLTRHIRHHHTEGSVGCEVPKAPVIETATDRSNSAKSNQQRQRQKPRKTRPKSPGAVSATSRDQINSRLDPMGNITSVIRATSEVSNAVPVINGPINIRRLEDVTDKKTLYTEPIPLADTVVLNRRIEEKLYADRKAPPVTINIYFARNRE